MSFVPGTHFYRQKTKYTKPAANPVPTTTKNQKWSWAARVPCPPLSVCVLHCLCVFVISSCVCCLRRRCGARNACHGAGNARSGAATCIGACRRLHASSECPAPARVSLACLCMPADFVRPANKMIKHKALFVCVSGPCFLCALVYFCSRGDMSVGTNKRHPFSSWPVVGFCMHARAHTGIGASFCTHACLLAIVPAAATCCRRLPHLLPLLALRKPGPRSLGFGGHPGERP